MGAHFRGRSDVEFRILPAVALCHPLRHARDWQHRPQLDDVCQWWRGGGRGVLALVGMGGASKTAIAERFLRVLPGGLPGDPDVDKDGSLPTPPGVFVFSFYGEPNRKRFSNRCKCGWNMRRESKPRCRSGKCSSCCSGRRD